MAAAAGSPSSAAASAPAARARGSPAAAFRSAERKAAAGLPRALAAGAEAAALAEDPAAAAMAVLEAEPLLQPDYVEVADLDGLRVLAAAVRVGSTRLIDNVTLRGTPA